MRRVPGAGQPAPPARRPGAKRQVCDTDTRPPCLFLFFLSSSPRQARTDWSFWLDERLFSNRLLASRTSRLLSQKEIVSTALARNPCQNPVERNLGIRRMATLAGLHQRFGFADGVAVYRDQFNSWPLQKFVPIESTLQCPLIFV